MENCSATATKAYISETSTLTTANASAKICPRKPKRCFQCETRYKFIIPSKPLSLSSLSTLPTTEVENVFVAHEIAPSSAKKQNRCATVLEAKVENKMIRCKLNPELLLEARVKGKSITCNVVIGKRTPDDRKKGLYHTSRLRKRKGKHDLDDAKESRPSLPFKTSMGISKRQKSSPPNDIVKDDTTIKIQKLIATASMNDDNTTVQDYTCAALRKYIVNEVLVSYIVRLGGIRMLANAMSNHPDRPIILAQAMRTLADIAWVNPSFGSKIVKEGCLKLIIASMDRHGTYSKVQQMGCGLFLALSYELECCHAMLKSNAIMAVVESMRRNPKKLNVLKEGR